MKMHLLSLLFLHLLPSVAIAVILLLIAVLFFAPVAASLHIIIVFFHDHVYLSVVLSLFSFFFLNVPLFSSLSSLFLFFIVFLLLLLLLNKFLLSSCP